MLAYYLFRNMTLCPFTWNKNSRCHIQVQTNMERSLFFFFLLQIKIYVVKIYTIFFFSDRGIFEDVSARTGSRGMSTGSQRSCLARQPCLRIRSFTTQLLWIDVFLVSSELQRCHSAPCQTLRELGSPLLPVAGHRADPADRPRFGLHCFSVSYHLIHAELLLSSF